MMTIFFHSHLEEVILLIVLKKEKNSVTRFVNLLSYIFFERKQFQLLAKEINFS